MIPRIIFMVLSGLGGFFLGGVIQRRFLRDFLRIEMFGYDRMQGKDPDRIPQNDDDGGLLISILTTALVWFFGLKIYNAFLIAADVAETHQLNEGMHKWTFAGYNLVLAGLFAFLSDWWNIITVIDQMLQGFDVETTEKHLNVDGTVAPTASTGFKAYVGTVGGRGGREGRGRGWLGHSQPLPTSHSKPLSAAGAAVGFNIVVARSLISPQPLGHPGTRRTTRHSSSWATGGKAAVSSSPGCGCWWAGRLSRRS